MSQTTETPPASETQDGKTAQTAAQKDQAGRVALKGLCQPVAGILWVVRIIAAASAVLTVFPYVALVQIGGLALDAASSGTPLDTDALHAALRLLIWTFMGRLGLYALALLISHFADAYLRTLLYRRILDRLAHAPLAYFSENASGQVRKAVQGDVHQLHMLVAHAPTELTVAAISPATLLVYAFVVDWRLGLLSLATIPFFLGYYAYMIKDMGPKTAQMDTYLGRVSATMAEFVSGITVVKAFGKTGQAHRNYQQAAENFAKFYLNWCQPLLRGSAISESIVSVALLLLINLGGGALLVQGGYVTPVQVLTTALIALILPGTMQTLSTGLWSYQLAGGAALRLQKMLQIPQISAAAAQDTVIPQLVAGLEERGKAGGLEVVFDRVDFSYGNTKALDQVSFTLQAGTTTALIGPSGSGKSTAATLLARFNDVAGGTITIGGVDIRQIPDHQLYRLVGFVLQDSQILRASIRENIALGRPEATEQEIHQAATAAQIADFIDSLPEGYDTILGQDTKLSGGQEQRIAIARALVQNTPILILDEATAMTDPDCEAEIQRALGNLVRGRTVLVIAHRPASIMEAQQIVVLDHGCVQACGTAEELADQPHFARLVEQSRGGLMPGIEPEDGGPAPGDLTTPQTDLRESK